MKQYLYDKYQYDTRAQLQSACLKEIQLQEDAKLFALLFTSPMSPPKLHPVGTRTHPKPQHNIWLRRYYMKQFKKNLDKY